MNPSNAPVLVCKILGVVFILVAIWGFVTGTEVLIFSVNTVHNVVHLLSGIGALACGFAGFKASKAFCLAFGAVYLLVAILGFMNVEPVNRLLNLNNPDDFLHLGLAAIFLGAGLMAMKAPDGARTPARV